MGFPLVFTPVYGVGAENIFQMVEEASTGHSGALGRQLTLNSVTAADCPPCALDDVLAELEAADAAGLVNLRGRGLRNGFPTVASYLEGPGHYSVGGLLFDRAALLAAAQSGSLLLTLTAHLRRRPPQDAAAVESEEEPAPHPMPPHPMPPHPMPPHGEESEQ